MKIGIVRGTVVSTHKDSRLVGYKFLIVQEIDADRNIVGGHEVAVDTLDAGIGETVLLCSGSSAKLLTGDVNMPIDLAVIGIVDTMDTSN
ncbi:MAG: EutN/CcmL family microcompartment protein [Synergistaceae bacterium]|jgi:ethanolamine utilization protein EutN|nr:EutN/CcmL family microcompartment protein [Synergistaceae bacterium]